MLGIDRPRAKRQQVEPATDPAVSPLREEIRFKGKGRAEIYAWVARTLRQHGYSRQNRAAKGLLRQYLVKMTGLSRAQITRLIQQYRQGGELPPARYRRHRCPQVHARRRRTAGGGGRGPRNPQRPGHAQDPRAGIPAVPAARIRAAGGDLGGPDLSPAAAQRLPPAAAAFHQDPAHGGVDRRAAPARPARPARLSASERCIKGIAMASRASTTSMPWMKSPSGKWSAPQPRSVKPGWSRY